MHNIIKKLFIAVLTVIMICGCSLNKINVKTEEKIYETEDESVVVEIPVISGMKNKEFETELNNEYSNTINDMIKAYTEASQKSKGERNEKSRLELKQTVTYNQNDILSIVSESCTYTEGLNGTSSRTVKNINTDTNTVLLLGDIFTDDEYTKMLNERLKKQSEDAKYSDLWEMPVVGSDQNEYFYFSDSGLVLFYPPYELSYYARGFVEFTIPYSDLYGYLKPEYSFLY